jgi:electron transfer flavoprotein alpha subunit
MSNFIVLIKQVPDISKISDNCFNPETGTLIRSKLPSVLNDLDGQAMSFAAHMRRLQGGAGKMALLTMGPPSAEEALRFGLKRGADVAVLLTDKAFGGADTVATANPLAAGIRHVVRDFFNDSQDYYVVCGMQSVDGDTAQVPPQVAEDLGVTCLTYVTNVERKDDRFEFTRIVSGGSQVISPIRLPAVITVAKFEMPLFSSFFMSRKASRVQLIKLGNNDVHPTLIGLEGSKTSVFRVFQPDKSQRKCIALHSSLEMAAKIIESFEDSGDEHDGKVQKAHEGYVLPSKRASLWDRNYEGGPRDTESVSFLEGLFKEMGFPLDRDLTAEEKEALLTKANKRFSKNSLEDLLAGVRNSKPSFPGEVWVMAEHDQGKVHAATLELLGKSRELADTLETKTGVLLLGVEETGRLAQELIAAGADKVYLLLHPLLAVFDPFPWRKAVAETVLRFNPGILLFGATAQGRTLAPLVSYRTGNGLTADCTGFAIHDFTSRRKVALLFQTRPALGGNIMATIFTKNSTTQMATARSGVFKRCAPDLSRRGEVITVPFEISKTDLSWRIHRNEVMGHAANFNAEVIVSGGKGVRNAPNYNELTGNLIASLSKKLGTRVEKGASRAAVEHGFVERAYQVGQTGTAISPKIYLALGISGAIQHMIGIANTKNIFAINSDPNAPIFKQCDYYLVGNIDEVVPELIGTLQELSHGK